MQDLVEEERTGNKEQARDLRARKARENKGKKEDRGGGQMKKAAVVSHFVTVC